MGKPTYPFLSDGAIASQNFYQKTGEDGKTTATLSEILKGYNVPIFAKATMKEFWDASILPQIVNVEYEAELKKFGDKVYIRRDPEIEVELSYQVNDDLKYDNLIAGEPVELVIDRAFKWGFLEHDVVTQQTDLKSYITKTLAKVAQKIRDKVEPDAFRNIINQVLASNAGNDGEAAGVASGAYNLGAPEAEKVIDLSTTGDTLDKLSVKAANLCADLYGVLHEQNVLDKGQTPFIVAPHKFLNVLAKSALQTSDYAEGGTTQSRGQKAVGMVQGCQLYTSNYIRSMSVDGNNATEDKATGFFPILCGTKDAITWAQTITKIETLRHMTQFADIHRGMGIYGFKLLEPKALALAWVKF